MTEPIIEGDADLESRGKSPALRALINEALKILESLGIPLTSLTSRRLERMAMVFIAVADVNAPMQWQQVKSILDGRSLRTRDIIERVNTVFAETISPGSYDDIRRKDLALPVLGEIIVSTHPDAARNSAIRGYALSADAASVIRTFGTSEWHENLSQWHSHHERLSDTLSPQRVPHKTEVTLPSGIQVLLSVGEHNLLQKAIIEEFLPRFGYQSEVLYVGDAADRLLVLEKDKLIALNFFELAHGELPDVVAYSTNRNRIYLIEAVHTSGAITNQRKVILQRLTSAVTAEIVFITAFLNRKTLRRFVSEIAWETFVWVAEEPDHLIHFNGGAFLASEP